MIYYGNTEARTILILDGQWWLTQNLGNKRSWEIFLEFLSQGKKEMRTRPREREGVGAAGETA